MNTFDGMWPPPALVPEAYVYDSAGQIVGPRHEPDDEPAVSSRVRHDSYGPGTVQQRDGEWLLVLFDGTSFASSVHVDDTEPEGE